VSPLHGAVAQNPHTTAQLAAFYSDIPRYLAAGVGTSVVFATGVALATGAIHLYDWLRIPAPLLPPQVHPDEDPVQREKKMKVALRLYSFVFRKATQENKELRETVESLQADNQTLNEEVIGSERGWKTSRDEIMAANEEIKKLKNSSAVPQHSATTSPTPAPSAATPLYVRATSPPAVGSTPKPAIMPTSTPLHGFGLPVIGPSTTAVATLRMTSTPASHLVMTTGTPKTSNRYIDREVRKAWWNATPQDKAAMDAILSKPGALEFVDFLKPEDQPRTPARQSALAAEGSIENETTTAESHAEAAKVRELVDQTKTTVKKLLEVHAALQTRALTPGKKRTANEVIEKEIEGTEHTTSVLISEKAKGKQKVTDAFTEEDVQMIDAHQPLTVIQGGDENEYVIHTTLGTEHDMDVDPTDTPKANEMDLLHRQKASMQSLEHSIVDSVEKSVKAKRIEAKLGKAPEWLRPRTTESTSASSPTRSTEPQHSDEAPPAKRVRLTPPPPPQLRAAPTTRAAASSRRSRSVKSATPSVSPSRRSNRVQERGGAPNMNWGKLEKSSSPRK
jgi:hypothetical protein